ncbi:putative metallophosphoesterase [bacterium BMS3Abin04]|nr:putative metallophosphoesterase [bacterium BMS3Abin04]
MKQLKFVFFFSLVFSIYSLINYYIIFRGLVLFTPGSPNRYIFIFLIIFLALSFIIGRIWEKYSTNTISTILIWMGSFYVGFMVYTFLQLVLIDFLRLLNYLFGIFPGYITDNFSQTNKITGIIVISISVLVVIAGHINTLYPKIKYLKLKINKNAGRLNELNIVTLSDLHIGTLIGKKYLSKVVSIVNSLKPDIILIPGDIIDEDLAPVIENNLGEVLKTLTSPYGTYAVTGNHEYIGGVNKAKKYLTDHNIKLLSDRVELIDDSFYVIGREDLSMNYYAVNTQNGLSEVLKEMEETSPIMLADDDPFDPEPASGNDDKSQSSNPTPNRRKELPEILQNIDKSLPMILLDHQPFKLKQAVENEIDLQLSGHTHYGQLWPFNFITNLVYELSWGYKKKGNTHFYISCGVGGWGPPIRTVGRPEIIKIELKFN